MNIGQIHFLNLFQPLLPEHARNPSSRGPETLGQLGQRLPVAAAARDRFQQPFLVSRLLGIEDIRPDSSRRESAQTERQMEVSRILRHLDERERQIIQHRFGLDRDRNPMTLKQVGQVMGVTKERIRQLEARAMAKLRDAASEERVESPEDEDYSR